MYVCERKKGPIDFKSFENYSTFNIFWFNMASGDQTASITLKFVQKRIYRLANISNLKTRKRHRVEFSESMSIIVQKMHKTLKILLFKQLKLKICWP